MERSKSWGGVVRGVLCTLTAAAALSACGSSASDKSEPSKPSDNGGGGSTSAKAGGSGEADPSSGASNDGGTQEGGTGGEAGAHSNTAPGEGGAAGEAGAAGAASLIDPCAGIPEGGECLADNSIRACVVPTGNGTPTVVTRKCDASSLCAVGAGGASCVPKPGKCITDATRCTTATSTGECVAGSWVDSPCPTGCRATAVGAFCTDGAATKTYTGTLDYQGRAPKLDYTDWGDVNDYSAAGLLVLSMHGDTLVDASVTDDNGAFSVKTGNPVQTGDRIVLLLVHPNDAATGFAFTVAQPDLPDGIQSVFATQGDSPGIWQWSIDPSTTASGSTVEITEDLGSGAIRIYEYLRYAYDVAEAHYGHPGLTLVAWLRYNTGWNCGSCFAAVPASLGSLSFDSQAFFPALAQNTSFWSDPVTAHELGHWVMQSFGVMPNEGGQHCVGVPTLPGQAWAEGWATGFSSLARGESLFYDKQEGTMFWIDLASRAYSSGDWLSPTPSKGLLQDMDENEVASMIWRIASQPTVNSADPMLDALASTRLLSAPFARGYSRHTWGISDEFCDRVDVKDTGQSVPMVADFLDALRCGGVSSAAIDAVVNPTTSYPYPSATPLCK